MQWNRFERADRRGAPVGVRRAMALQADRLPYEKGKLARVARQWFRAAERDQHDERKCRRHAAHGRFMGPLEAQR